MLIINKHFNFFCFRYMAYTTLDRLCAVFLYDICCFITVSSIWQISNLDNSANKWVLHRLKLKICKLRALVGLDISAPIMFPTFVQCIHLYQYTSLFIIIMTSRKKSSSFEFWSCVICAWTWCICPPNFAQIALSNSEVLTFSEIQDVDRRHLGFSVYVNLAILACW